MRSFFGSITASVLIMLGTGCNTVDPDECWPNTSGGFGGSGTIPIGAGVGASTGDFLTPPRRPLDSGDAPNPCVTPPSPKEDACKGVRDMATDGHTYAFCSKACPQNSAPCTAGVISMFRPSNFSFSTIIADDGTDIGGGWQETKTVLAFADGLFDITTCQLRIGMPLRSKAWGKVSADTAAVYSSNVANAAAANIWPTDLPSGIFCTKLKKEMGEQFGAKYQGLGAQMMAP
jgi:hypothetical protein